MPRIIEKHFHHENAPATTPYNYNVCSPFLEKVSKYNSMTLRMMGLVSSVIALKVEILISETAEFYKDELSSPNLLDEEFRRQKNKWRAEIPLSTPNSDQIYIYIYLENFKNCSYCSSKKLLQIGTQMSMGQE